MTLTPERLRELLHYDPETGIWMRLKDNTEAGWIDTSNGYRRIWVDGAKIYAHRLAWFWMTGEWPAALVDHEDEDPLNNRWSNLRQATKSTNGANRGMTVKNTSGLKGVSTSRQVSWRWRADIQVRGRKIYLGYFDCPVAAYLTYVVASDKHFGEFAKVA